MPILSCLPIFSYIRLFSPKHYPLEVIKRSHFTEHRFDKLLVRFDWNNDLADHTNEKYSNL